MMDDLQAVADAAIAGVGLAWLPSWLIAHYVLRGQLEAVLPSYREQPAPIHVIWPTAAHMPAKDALRPSTPWSRAPRVAWRAARSHAFEQVIHPFSFAYENIYH